MSEMKLNVQHLLADVYEICCRITGYTTCVSPPPYGCRKRILTRVFTRNSVWVFTFITWVVSLLSALGVEAKIGSLFKIFRIVCAMLYAGYLLGLCLVDTGLENGSPLPITLWMSNGLCAGMLALSGLSFTLELMINTSYIITTFLIVDIQ